MDITSKATNRIIVILTLLATRLATRLTTRLTTRRSSRCTYAVTVYLPLLSLLSFPLCPRSFVGCKTLLSGMARIRKSTARSFLLLYRSRILLCILLILFLLGLWIALRGSTTEESRSSVDARVLVPSFVRYILN